MPSPIPQSDFATPPFTEALAAVRAELDRIPAAELEPVTLDVRAAVFATLGAAPKVREHRAAMAQRFGETQAAHVERLEVAARAAGKAHADYQIEISGADLAPMSEAVIAVRTTLLVDAQSLVHRKLLDAGLLGELQGIQGAKNQCFDVLQLVGAFRKSWAAVEAHTPVKAADLDRAEALANQLATAAGIREQAIAGVSPSADLRRRAYTLLVRTYAEVRRMVTYLRWAEGDADAIAPSLWAGRQSPRREVTPGLAVPTPSNGQTGASPIAPGLPGASPFVAS